MRAEKREKGKAIGSTIDRKRRRNDENQEVKLKTAMCKDKVSII